MTESSGAAAAALIEARRCKARTVPDCRGEPAGRVHPAQRRTQAAQQFLDRGCRRMQIRDIFVGIIGVWYSGCRPGWPRWRSCSHGSARCRGRLSARGPLFGVPQLLRPGWLGFLGNILPPHQRDRRRRRLFRRQKPHRRLRAGTRCSTGNELLPVIIVVVELAARSRHNLVHAFERWAFGVLVVIFAIASVVILSKSHPGGHATGIPGGFLITFGRRSVTRRLESLRQ